MNKLINYISPGQPGVRYGKRTVGELPKTGLGTAWAMLRAGQMERLGGTKLHQAFLGASPDAMVAETGSGELVIIDWQVGEGLSIQVHDDHSSWQLPLDGSTPIQLSGMEPYPHTFRKYRVEWVAKVEATDWDGAVMSGAAALYEDVYARRQDAQDALDRIAPLEPGAPRRRWRDALDQYHCCSVSMRQVLVEETEE